MSIERAATELTLGEIQTRLRRVERQNCRLVALLCVAVAIALVATARAGPNVLSVNEIRAHRISLLDPTGVVVASWYSNQPGSYIGP